MEDKTPTPAARPKRKHHDLFQHTSQVQANPEAQQHYRKSMGANSRSCMRGRARRRLFEETSTVEELEGFFAAYQQGFNCGQQLPLQRLSLDDAVTSATYSTKMPRAARPAGTDPTSFWHYSQG